MHNHKLYGLYAITDAMQTDLQQLLADVEQALLGGASIIQYRDKTTSRELRHNTAEKLRTLTRQHNALFIINDDVQLAKQSHADGVHLGRNDSSIADAREQLGATTIIGVSCYNDFSLAKQAAKSGADYIAFGRFFPSRTKPHAPPATMKIIQKAKHELDIPIVAIGGITAENAHSLINAGVDMLAVVNDIFAQDNITIAAQRYQTLFNETQQ